MNDTNTSVSLEEVTHANTTAPVDQSQQSQDRPNDVAHRDPKSVIRMPEIYREENCRHSVQTRIMIQGPPEAMDEFKREGLRREGCQFGGSIFYFVFPVTNPKLPKWEWHMDLLDDVEDVLLRFDCFSAEKMPDDFLQALAERWPELQFYISTWVQDDVRVCEPEGFVSI